MTAPDSANERSFWPYLFWLFSPLLTALLGFKALKMLKLSHRGERLLEPAIVLVLAAVVCVSFVMPWCLLWIERGVQRWGRKFWVFLGLALLLFVVGEQLYTSLQIRWSQDFKSIRFLSYTNIAFQFGRYDVFFVFVLMLCCGGVLSWAQGLLRRILWVGIHVMLVVLMFMASADVSLTIMSGAVGDWFMLSYFLSHSGNITAFFDFTPQQYLQIFLPVLCAMMPWLLSLFGLFRRRVAEVSWAIPSRSSLSLSAIGLILLLALPGFRYTFSFGQLLNNIFLDISRQAIGQMLTGSAKVDLSKAKTLFQTKDIVLKKASAQSSGTATTLPASKPPINVVTIILESTRSMSTTPYRPSMPTMPYLQKLAQRSLIAKQMFVAVPSTSKTWFINACGFYPKISMNMVEGSPAGIPGRCLPHLLQPLGYESAFFTSTSLALEYNDKMLGNVGYKHLFGLDQLSKKGYAELIRGYAYEDRIMTKPSLKWVQSMVDKQKPFFLTYATSTAHFPYIVPKSFKRKTYKTTNKHYRYQDYLNSLRYTDDFLKEVIEGFRAKGLIDSTIFVIVGDHGEAFREHGTDGHNGTIWDEGLQVPALIYNPKLFPTQRWAKGIRYNLDFVPTILELLGLAVKKGSYVGKSLRKEVSPQRELFFSCRFERHCLAMRKGQRKYIYHYGRRPMEVYDTSKDPLEKKNLLASVSKKKREQAKQKMLHWHRQINFFYETFHLKRYQADASKETRPYRHSHPHPPGDQPHNH